VGTRRPSKWSGDTVPTPHVRREGGEEAAGGGRGVGKWILVFLVVLLMIVLLGLWGLYLLRGQWSSAGPTPTFVIWTPSPAPTRLASPTPAATEPATGEDGALPTISPGVAVGKRVQVAGTGGSGLNLRSGPGPSAGRMDVALDGEIFVVVAGPEIAADAEWWQIEDPDDPARRWWAAANYLEPVE